MLVIKNKHNGEVLESKDTGCVFSVEYNHAKDETMVYAFRSNILLFSLCGEAEDEVVDQAFNENWESKSIVGDYDIGIEPGTNHGWFEHHKLGEEAGGGLWFDEEGILEDYDGVFNLPEDVVKGIRELGYKVPDTICVDGYWNDSKEEFSYNAIIGESEEVDDEDIFYQFDNADEVIGDHGGFTITSFCRML